MNRTQRKRWMITGGAVAATAALVYLWRNRPVNTQAINEKLETSLRALHPDFAARIRTLMWRMERRGFTPMVWETGRSFDRAEELEERGTGVAKSMHSYGLAVDIVDEKTLWGAPAQFWAALEEEAIDLGLTTGAAFGDKNHIQALPTKYDNTVRRNSPAQNATLVRQYLRTV